MTVDLLNAPNGTKPHGETYDAPQLIEYGRVEHLTEMGSVGIPGDCDPGDPSSCF
jgi:hypothetical protein